MSAASAKRILLIDAHPDGSEPHLCHALADMYAQGAKFGGHEVRRLKLADLDFPLLRSRKQWEDGAVPQALVPVQRDILWAEHIVFVFPLWLGGMPALLKGFLEQIARPGFALGPSGANPMGQKLLKGRSARVIVSMGMPAFVYRWFFRAHSLKALERNILGFVGIAPVDETLIGTVEPMSPARADKIFKQLSLLGGAAR